MASLEELQQIYTKYEEKLAKVTANASAFAGAFGMGDDPRNHACNEVFYEAVEEWVDAFVQDTTNEERTAQAVTWILDAPRNRKNACTYWYMYAAQKHACKLIPALRAEDADRIREKFVEVYPKLDWTPTQKEVYRLLSVTGTKGQEDGSKSDERFGQWGKRVAALLLGLAIAHLGVTLFLLAELGSDPFNVLIQGLFRVAGSALGLTITHGTVHVAVSLCIILILLAIDRSYIKIGTFLCMILGGPIIDVFTLILQGIINQNSTMPVRLIAVILGCVILAFGMTIVIKSQAGTGPNDLVAVVISDKRHWKFGVVRIAVDVCFAAIGFVLGGTIGIGTIVCVAVVGPVAQTFMPISERICQRMIGD